MTISRRTFLGWVGAAGLATAVGKRANAAAGKEFKGYPDSMGVLFDQVRCIGCRQCEEACNKVNSLPPPEQPFTDLTVLQQKRRTDAQTYTVVNQYSEPGPDKSPIFRKIQCNHCLEPACVRMAPSPALVAIGQFNYRSEADAAAAGVGLVALTPTRSHGEWGIGKSTAAENFLGSTCGALRIVHRRRTVIVAGKPIRTPLHHVAVHVVESKRIGGKGANRFELHLTPL